MKWLAYHRGKRDDIKAIVTPDADAPAVNGIAEVAMDNNTDIRNEDGFADNGGAETAAGAGSKEGVSDKDNSRLNLHISPDQPGRLQQAFAGMMIADMVLLVAQSVFCVGGIIPILAFWIAACLVMGVSIAGIILAACEQLGGVNCFLAALILQLVACGLILFQMILGVVAVAFLMRM